MAAMEGELRRVLCRGHKHCSVICVWGKRATPGKTIRCPNRFTLMKMLPTPDLRKEGSLCAHMMRMGLPLMTW